MAEQKQHPQEQQQQQQGAEGRRGQETARRPGDSDKRTGADPTTAPATDSPSEDFYSGRNRKD